MKPRQEKSETAIRLWPLLLCMICSAVVAIGVWEGVVRGPQQAYAIQPLAGPTPKIKELIEVQKQTNTKLDQIITILKEDPIHVTVVKPKSPPAPSRKP